MYDVIIIGSGVSGSALPRELSRYDLKIGVLEKEEDVAVEHPRRTAESCMPDLMPARAV